MSARLATWGLALVLAALGSGCQLVFPLDPGHEVVVFANRGAEDLIDFPVLVSIGASTIDHAEVADPATDLRFLDADGTELPFEVDHWDPEGESLVWVRVPQIDRDSLDDHVELHYGRGIGAAAPAAVWDGYDLVHHFDRSLTDSSPAKHGGRSDGSLIVAAGHIGTSRAFEGIAASPELITFADSGSVLDGWPVYTLELWFRPDWTTAAELPDDRTLFGKSGGPVHNVRFFPAGGGIVMQSDVTCRNGSAIVNSPVALGTWTYLAFTYDGVTVRMYFDGVEVSSDDCGGSLLDGSNVIELGSSNTAARATFDELRISQVVRSPQWLRAQYLSMTRELATVQ